MTPAQNETRATAARLHSHGEPLSIEDLAIGPPTGDEVLVEMAFGGLNPVDRYGILGLTARDGPLPRTMGTEGSGTANGAHVMVHGAGVGTIRDGIWSTTSVVPSSAITRVPDGVTLQQAATVGVAGATAWRVVTQIAKVTTEDRVLVLGSSGGVGSMIVSLLRSTGATVWGQTENEAKRRWIEDRGAGHVVVCGAEDLAAVTGELAPTVVFDALGGGFTGGSTTVMAENGRLVLFGSSAGTSGEVPLQLIYRKNLTIFGYGGLIASAEVLAEAKQHALQAVASGEMEVAIGASFPLERVNEAVDSLAKRAVPGKILLELNP